MSFFAVPSNNITLRVCMTCLETWVTWSSFWDFLAATKRDVGDGHLHFGTLETLAIRWLVGKLACWFWHTLKINNPCDCWTDRRFHFDTTETLAIFLIAGQIGVCFFSFLHYWNINNTCDCLRNRRFHFGTTETLTIRVISGHIGVFILALLKQI